MKIGAQTSLFNFSMRERRLEMGWTQKELAARCGFNVNTVSQIESLALPDGNIETVRRKLNTIAQVLELPFSDVFPQDYLDAIQHKKLPRRREPIIWCREVSISELDYSHPYLIEQSAEDVLIEIETEERKIQEVRGVVDLLPAQNKAVLALRFGLLDPDGATSTLEEVGRMLGVSRERVRQIEHVALCRLRHPKSTMRIGEFKR